MEAFRAGLVTAGIGSVSTIFTNMNMSVLLGRELEIKTALLLPWFLFSLFHCSGLAKNVVL